MKLNSIIKSPRVATWLQKQIGYYSDQLFLVDGDKLVAANESTKKTKLVIVAKCHYSETWQTIPSVNRNELDKILMIKGRNQSQSVANFQVYKNAKVDGFDVRTISLDKDVVAALGDDKVYIAETDLLAQRKNNTLLEIDTPKGKLFCASLNDIVKSSYAKGIVANIDTYKLTVGLPSDVSSFQIKQSEFLPYLLNAFFSCSISKLTAISIFDIKSWFNWPQLHLLYWAPLVTAICFYLFTSGYYFFKAESISRNLELGGSEVNQILKQKRMLDKNQAEIAALSLEFEAQNFVHNHWRIIDKLVDEGVSVTRISFKEGLLTIRGTAEKASNILASVSEHPSVTSAAFQGAVRKSRGNDSFILNIEVKEHE